MHYQITVIYQFTDAFQVTGIKILKLNSSLQNIFDNQKPKPKDVSLQEKN